MKYDNWKLLIVGLKVNNGTLTKDIITEIVINMGDIFEVLIIIEQN